MSSPYETFFRPDETTRERVTVPAPLFNRCQLLLNQARSTHVFVPVRSMQVQAVINHDEIIFVDNLGYAVREGHGGRLIVLAWEIALEEPRSSVSEPVPIDIIYYGNSNYDTHCRLMGEFPRALENFEARLKETDTDRKTACIMPFSSH